MSCSHLRGKCPCCSGYGHYRCLSLWFYVVAAAVVDDVVVVVAISAVAVATTAAASGRGFCDGRDVWVFLS